jgi:uncharacterized membrane protein
MVTALPMVALELACLAILAAYFVAHRREPSLLRDAALLGLGALIGEDTMIRAYGFYFYAPGWHQRVDHVPLLIPTIWAPVVLSARAVARALLRSPEAPAWKESALTAALVTFDAALIEPIAVRAGLWRWTQPGVMHVPLIGIVGWGCYAFAATWLLRALPPGRRWLMLPGAVLASHAMVLALWWGALRWTLRAELPLATTAPALAFFATLYTIAVVKTGARLPWRELLPRAAATGFFAVLLAGRADAAMVLWAAMFTPPWLVFCARALRGR